VIYVFNKARWNIVVNEGLLYLFTSKEDGLEVDAEGTKRMLLSCHQSDRQNYNMKIANRFFERR
jgi:hypothetical protein